MNPHHHSYAPSLGPCEHYEFDLVERSEGALDAQRALVVQQHLERCGRCRAYAAALDQLDASLAAALPRPRVSADFEANLAARIAAVRRVPDRAAARAEAEHQHQFLLRQLGRSLDWRTLLNAIALGAAAGGLLLGLESFVPGMLQLLNLVPAGVSASTAFSVVLGVVFLAAGLGFGRKLQGGPLLRGG